MRNVFIAAVISFGFAHAGCAGCIGVALVEPAPMDDGGEAPVGDAGMDGGEPDAGKPPPTPVQAPILQRTLATSWDEAWLSSPTAADLDGDGKPELIVARHSVLSAWKSDGTLLWNAAFGKSAVAGEVHGDRRMWASPVVGDFDGDGDVEIAVASDVGADPDANVALYDHTGKLLAGWPRKFGTTELRSIAAADVDDDGKLEVILNKLSDGPSTTVLGLDGVTKPGWPQVNASTCDPPGAPPCLDFGGYNQNVGAADLDGDGVDDVVTTYDLMAFGIFSGGGTPHPAASVFTDRVVTGVEAYFDYALAKQGFGTGDRSEFTDSPPVIADLFGDGTRAIILNANHESSQSTASQGFSLWVFRPDATRPIGWETPKDLGGVLTETEPSQNIVLTRPSLAVGQLDASAPLEIIAQGYDGALYAYSAAGARLWRFEYGTKSASPYLGGSEPVLVDLNGDGETEILFATYSSGAPRLPGAQPHLFVLSAQGLELHRVPLPGRGCMAAPTVADLDGDGALELVLNLKDTLTATGGGVQIFSLPGSYVSGVRWGTGRGNSLRTGVGGSL